MPRLNREGWDLAKAEYEARGTSLRGVAKLVGVDPMAVQRRAKREGWEQGKGLRLVEDKVAALKDLHRIEKIKSTLPPTSQALVDVEVDHRLAEEGLSRHLRTLLMEQGLKLISAVTTPSAWYHMASGAAKLTAACPPRDQWAPFNKGSVALFAGLDLGRLSPEEYHTFRALLDKACIQSR